MISVKCNLKLWELYVLSLFLANEAMVYHVDYTQYCHMCIRNMIINITVFRCHGYHKYQFITTRLKYCKYTSKSVNLEMLMCVHHFSIIQEVYLSAICWSELPLGSDIMRSEMVCRRRWKEWGRGWAASPAITMSDRGCSQTPRSLSCRVKMYTIRRFNNTTKVMLQGFLSFNH